MTWRRALGPGTPRKPVRMVAWPGAATWRGGFRAPRPRWDSLYPGPATQGTAGSRSTEGPAALRLLETRAAAWVCAGGLPGPNAGRALRTQRARRPGAARAPLREYIG